MDEVSGTPKESPTTMRRSIVASVLAVLAIVLGAVGVKEYADSREPETLRQAASVPDIDPESLEILLGEGMKVSPIVISEDQRLKEIPQSSDAAESWLGLLKSGELEMASLAFVTDVRGGTLRFPDSEDPDLRLQVVHDEMDHRLWVLIYGSVDVPLFGARGDSPKSESSQMVVLVDADSMQFVHSESIPGN